MNTLFILIVVITNNYGIEYSNKVSGEIWASEQLCKIEKETFSNAIVANDNGTSKHVKFECIQYYIED